MPGVESAVFGGADADEGTERTARGQSELEYWTDGDQASGPAVMLVHGRWGRVSIWIGSPRYGLFLRMPTRPNYGGSSEHGSYDYASFADDVSQLVDFLGVQRLHVIGGSSGDP